MKASIKYWNRKNLVLNIFISKGEKQKMKKRRSAIVAFVLCACLIVGVGFAAITSNLKVDHYVSLGVNDAAFDVHFESAGAVASNTNAAQADYGAKVSADNDMLVDVNIKAGVLAANGDTVTITALIHNNSADGTFRAKFGDPSQYAPVASGDSGILNYVDVECAFQAIEGSAEINDDGTVVLEPGQTVNLVIVVTLAAMPTEAITNASFTITATATAVEIPKN